MGKLLFIGLFLLITASAHGAIRYVDKDNACPGAGSTGDPYCSIANAVAVVAAGDTIRIRDAASAYTETLSITTEGTVNSPITVEPDSGHNPTLRNSGNGGGCANFWIIANYWIIQNLNFDATGVTPCVFGAILLHANGRDVIGHKILNNTFREWGGPETPPTTAMAAVVISGGANGPSAGFWPRDILVQGNNFVDNRLISLNITHARNVTVENNTFSGTKCGRDSDATNELGIKAIYYNEGLTIRGNVFRDFAASSGCGLTNQGNATYAAYWCDVGTSGTTPNVIEKNLIYNIDQGVNGFGNSNGISRASHGLFIEAGCGNHIVRNNVIYNIGNIGITQSFHVLNQTQPNLYYNNTIYGTDYGIFSKEGVATFKNNIVKNASLAQVCHGCGSGSPSLLNITYDYNLYDDGASQTLIGLWAGAGTFNLANWKTQCSCDTNSTTGDPLFISTTGGSENFALQSTSPAINAGVNVGYAYNGSAPDKGVFETLAFTSAEVGTINATTAVLTFENNLAPPLLPASSCTGFSVEEDTGGGFAAVTVSTCARSATNLVSLGLGSSITGGSTVRFSYSTGTGNVTDSMLVGNSAVQRLNALTNQSITNNVGGSPSHNFAATVFQFYGLRTNSGNLSILPHTAAAINTNVSVVPGATFNIAIQTDCTAADCPGAGQLLYYSKNSGAYAAIPSSFGADNIKMFGNSTLASDIQNEGTTIAACLSGALTPVTGLVVRTANAIPTFDMAQNGCVVNRWTIEFDTDVSIADTYDFRPYDQAGSAINTYTVTPRATIIGDRAAGGGA